MRIASLFVLGCGLWAQDLNVYQDGLLNGFQNWSWATVNLNATTQVHAGSAAISFEPDNWEAVYLQRQPFLDVANYDALHFWIYAVGGGQNLSISLINYNFSTSSSQVLGSVDLNSVTGTLPANTWFEVTVPFDDLGVMVGSFNGFYIQANTAANQAECYLDDLSIRARSGGPPQGSPVTIQAFPTQNLKPIDPRIYGVNTMEPPALTAPKYPFLRWGGNTSSRYAWDVDAHNVGFDWFYFSYPEPNPAPQNLPNGSLADRFLADSQTRSVTPLLTVPTIGWVAKDRTQRWSFGTDLYGDQEETECTWFTHQGQPQPGWCNPLAGNGIDVNGNPITVNDKNDANKPVDPTYIMDWVTHLQGQFGTAANGGIQNFALDNEPMLWNSTHADVHAEPLGYDDLWQMTQDYGSAIKSVEPDAVIFGPAVWGWCAYFASAIDAAEGGSCVDGSDRQAHGGQPLLEWLLDQVCAYQTNNGVRLIDVLDVHYYPQIGNFVFSDSDAQADLRFDSLRALYDPSFVDGSWIPDAVQLIPRMKTIIEDHCPGLELAVTEYNFGGDNSITSALAQVEALGLFGREGLDIATRWVMPDAGSKVEDAFRLYLDYDGAGNQVSGSSFRLDNLQFDEVSGFGIVGSSQSYIVLINKTQLAREVTVQWTGLANQSFPVYQFDGSTTVHQAGTTTPIANGLQWTVPGYAASLIVINQASCTGSAVSYYPLWPTGYSAGLDIAPPGNPDNKLNLLDMVLSLTCP
ncbi:MAG: glycoside hydrolase family 44 protein [Acidobacteria bacterium]|nr:glycoside hydrolase family 44 protein [Acidobacteriota bacterium]